MRPLLLLLLVISLLTIANPACIEESTDPIDQNESMPSPSPTPDAVSFFISYEYEKGLPTQDSPFP